MKAVKKTEETKEPAEPKTGDDSESDQDFEQMKEGDYMIHVFVQRVKKIQPSS